MFKIANLDQPTLGRDRLVELYKTRWREQLWVSLGIIVVISITFIDAFEDFNAEDHLILIAGDLLYMFFMLLLLAYIWRHLPMSLKKANVMLTAEVASKQKDAQVWQEKVSEVMRNFSELISEQFQAWALTNAEREVAIMLLKGLSIKEIAVARGTSSNTVRQQAASLYNKAKLNSRAELSAFFLEDLLIVS